MLNYYMIVTERITKFPWNFLFLPFSFGNEAYYKVIGKKNMQRKYITYPRVCSDRKILLFLLLAPP